LTFLFENQIQRYGYLELYARQTVEGFITGLHKSPFHGFSSEFSEHRLYNQGESVKHVDWKVFGRTDKLFVKRFEEETNLRCQILIDNSSSMFFPFNKKNELINQSKINYAVFCAAVLIQLLKQQRDAFGLTVFSSDIEFHTEAKLSAQHHKFLLTHLDKIIQQAQQSQRKTTSAANAIHNIAERIHKRSLVIIFTDMFESNNNTDELMSALQHLRHNKHEVIVFHVFDQQKEVDFNYENRPHKFIDIETNEKLTLNPNEIRNFYKKRINELFKSLHDKCLSYRIDLVETDINKKPAEILNPYLTKRKRLY